MNTQIHLAQLIMLAHNLIQTQRGNEQLMIHQIQLNPTRLVVPNGQGILRQYHINDNSVRMDYFFSNDLIHLYDEIRGQFPDGENHDFGNSILGNGANDGATRSIHKSYDQGANASVEDGPNIAIACAHLFTTLLNQIEPHLPQDRQIPYHP